METINEAIELSEKKNPQSSWALVNVGVAPSTITISFTDSKKPPIECRVRFLSFLGIGQDSRQCAFIVHTAQDTFLAYAFHCEPHSGPLCKTIEAACTLRYQKCLDARPQRLQSPSPIDLATKKAGGDEQPAKQSHTTIKKALKTIFFGRPS
jgi:amyloid beta (A4) precursor protein-binding family B protein 2 (Fe65-like)